MYVQGQPLTVHTSTGRLAGNRPLPGWRTGEGNGIWKDRQIWSALDDLSNVACGHVGMTRPGASGRVGRAQGWGLIIKLWRVPVHFFRRQPWEEEGEGRLYAEKPDSP